MHYICNRCDVRVLSPPVLQFAIWSIFVESLLNNTENCAFFAVTQPILIGSQIEEQEVKAPAELHHLHIYHIVKRSELKFWIAAKVLSSRKWGSAVCKTLPEKRRSTRSWSLEVLLTGQFSCLAVPELNPGHRSGSNMNHAPVTWNRCSHWSRRKSTCSWKWWLMSWKLRKEEHLRTALTTLVEVISLPLGPITWKSWACTGGWS